MKKLLKIPARTIFAWLIILIPVCLLLVAFLSSNKGYQSIKATKGSLNLKNWRPEVDGNTTIDGEWIFYWHQLLEPKAFKPNNPPIPTGFIKLPGLWNDYKVDGNKLKGAGYATFSLLLKLDTAKANLYAFKVLTMSNAYKLWVGDKLLATNGEVGTDPEHSLPEYKPQVIPFKPTSDSIRITLQVSNFNHWKGGVWYPIRIGTLEQILKERENKLLLEIFLFGCLFIMAIYHFGLYFLQRKETGTLYFGLMCIAICCRSLFVGENIINAILPTLDWSIARKIEYVLTFMTVPIYLAFVRSLFLEEVNKRVFQVFCGVGITLSAFVLITPVSIFSMTSQVFAVYSWFASVYVIYIIVRATIKKREGSILFLATSLFFMITIVNDTLNQTELLQTGLYLPLGLMVVVFAQSFILSSRSALAFHTAEVYAATFQKFVPLQFLNRIAKEGIQSIKPGNAEKSELTVLFSDIRSFTTLSENMSPEEVFIMLNEYLADLEPPIRAHHGFVDKYMGDGIMALFEKSEQNNSAYNAVEAAIEMKAALVQHNIVRVSDGKPELKCGIGLHTGQVVIGIVGGDERMDSTAIGDTVNLASRIESMTKVYDTSILASEETINLLGKHKDKFALRFVDSVTAKGKTTPVSIWEVIGRVNE